MSPLSSRRYPQRGTLITAPERLILTTRERLILARRGDEHDIVQFLLPGRMVMRALAPCAADRTPPGDHAVKLTSHVPGRDHVTGPQTRMSVKAGQAQDSHTRAAHPAHPGETYTNAQRASRS